jgi:hypothetical protein
MLLGWCAAELVGCAGSQVQGQAQGTAQGLSVHVNVHCVGVAPATRARLGSCSVWIDTQSESTAGSEAGQSGIAADTEIDSEITTDIAP